MSLNMATRKLIISEQSLSSWAIRIDRAFGTRLPSETFSSVALLIHGSNLRKQIIDSLEIPIVSLGEQKRIAKCLNTIDNKLITEQVYLKKLQSIKQGLMSELLSGRKKVNVEKEAKKEMATE